MTSPLPLINVAAKNWWTFLLRGILAVLFGLMAFLWPGLTLGVLILVWGAFAFADGIFAIVSGVRSRWWTFVFFGALGVAAGLIAFVMPGITALALLMVIGAWAIVRGVFEIVAAVRLRKEITGEWALALAGAASVVLGGMMIGFPGAGALALVWLIGLQAFIAGVLMFALAFRLRRVHRDGGIRMNFSTGTPSGPGIRA
jgi:uncharacterized membrane protein HdeD (DUF308 family)